MPDEFKSGGLKQRNIYGILRITFNFCKCKDCLLRRFCFVICKPGLKNVNKIHNEQFVNLCVLMPFYSNKYFRKEIQEQKTED